MIVSITAKKKKETYKWFKKTFDGARNFCKIIVEGCSNSFLLEFSPPAGYCTIPGRYISVSGPPVQDVDDFGQVSQYLTWRQDCQTKEIV